MDGLFLTILNMSLTGAFIIGGICLARLILKRGPRIISYCLWAVAGLRLILPFSISSVFSLLPFNAETIPADIALQATPQINSGIPYVNQAVSRILPAATPYASANPLQIWIALGALIWIVGAGLLFVYGLVSCILLKRKMSTAIHLEANIYEAENIRSPFVLGIFKPRIYLPVNICAQERSYILLHEQTHIRRHDPIIKFAAYFILCLHWFNPLVWVAFRLMSIDMEMSCDERVLKEMGNCIKKDYSLSLLSWAAEGPMGSVPLAFGERGIKARIQNVLEFKKASGWMIAVSVSLAAVLTMGFAVNKGVDRYLPMQGTHLAQLQTDQILQHIVQVTRGNSQQLMVQPGTFQLTLTRNFEWMASDAVSFQFSRSKDGTEPYYSAQLRIFTEEGRYWVTQPQQQEGPQSPYLLKHYLNALKHLPQAHIQSLFSKEPDGYLILFRGNERIEDGQPQIFYDQKGLTDHPAVDICLDVQPMYAQADGTGYQGSGQDVIHVFYAEQAATAAARTYFLENPTLQQQTASLASISLYDNGNAILATPPISSYLLPSCTYAFVGDELRIYAAIQTEEEQAVFGLKNSQLIARFSVSADGALVFRSSNVSLFADEGARYVEGEMTFAP